MFESKLSKKEEKKDFKKIIYPEENFKGFNSQTGKNGEITIIKYLKGVEMRTIEPAKIISKPKKKRKRKLKQKIELNSHNAIICFYKTKKWRELRYSVLQKFDFSCMCCGRNRKNHSVVLHVDHIKPRSTYPDLELVFDNLQILCEDCNLGKNNYSQDDFRPGEI